MRRGCTGDETAPISKGLPKAEPTGPVRISSQRQEKDRGRRVTDATERISRSGLWFQMMEKGKYYVN